MSKKWKVIGVISGMVVLATVLLFKSTFSIDTSKVCKLDPSDVNYYVIKYNTNGGSKINDLHTSGKIPGPEKCRQDSSGGVICTGVNTENIMPIPTKSGYTFEGWYYDNYFGQKVSYASVYGIIKTRVNKYDKNGCYLQPTITFFAKWKATNSSGPMIFDGGCPSYTSGANSIVYNTNGGNQISNSSVCLVCGITSFPKLPVPTKSGYIFDGWYYDVDLTRKVDATTVDQVNFYSEYDTKGCKKPGSTTYLFAKWKTNSCTGLAYLGDISFETNGGNKINGIGVLKSCSNGIEKEKIPTPTKTGYTFDGWYYDKNLTQKVSETTSDAIYNKKKNSEGKLDVTLYAKWTQTSLNVEPTCLKGGGSKGIRFDSNGGTSIDDIAYCGGCATLSKTIPTPTRAGYTFEGWYYDKGLTQKVQGNTTTDLMNKGTSTKIKVIDEKCYIYDTRVFVYAKWSKTISCPSIAEGNFQLVFETNGGNYIENETVGVASNNNKAVPTPTREGYTFEGWYYNANFTSKVTETNLNEFKPKPRYDNQGCIRGYQPITIYAKWNQNGCKIVTDPIEFTINYVTNGGENISSNKFSSTNLNNNKLEKPVKNDAIFEGWYYDEAFTKKVLTNYVSEIMPSEIKDSLGCVIGYNDITLYARYVTDRTITLAGILTDGSGNPLALHTVELHSDVVSAITNEYGEYVINDVTEGNHTLFIKDINENEISNTNINILYNGKSDTATHTLAYDDSDSVLTLNLSVDENKDIKITNNYGSIGENKKLIIYICGGVLLVLILLIGIILIKKKKDSEAYIV